MSPNSNWTNIYPFCNDLSFSLSVLAHPAFKGGASRGRTGEEGQTSIPPFSRGEFLSAYAEDRGLCPWGSIES